MGLFLQYEFDDFNLPLLLLQGSSVVRMVHEKFARHQWIDAIIDEVDKCSLLSLRKEPH